MVTILTITTIVFLILFLHASYLYQKETEKVEELYNEVEKLHNNHTLSNDWYNKLEQQGFHPDFINNMKNGTSGSGYLFKQE